MSLGGYVKLKHALSAIALAVVEDGARFPTARALAAYSRLGERRFVPIAELALAAGTTEDDVCSLLVETGLFERGTQLDRLGLAGAYAPHAAYFAKHAGRLADAVRMLEAPARAGMPDVLRRGVALFNAGLFFECHEYLETAWRTAGGRDRAFYHGLIQAAAACYHCEKGNRRGTRALAGKAIDKLRGYAPAFQGIDVAALVGALEAVCASAGPDAASLPSRRDELPVMAPATAAGL